MQTTEEENKENLTSTALFLSQEAQRLTQQIAAIEQAPELSRDGKPIKPSVDKEKVKSKKSIGP